MSASHEFPTPRPEPKATVGRIVHYYNCSLADNANNGTGKGPYPAIVLQAFGGAYVNLKVMTWYGDETQGSVANKNDPAALASDRFWVWPPRD